MCWEMGDGGRDSHPVHQHKVGVEKDGQSGLSTFLTSSVLFPYGLELSTVHTMISGAFSILLSPHVRLPENLAYLAYMSQKTDYLPTYLGMLPEFVVQQLMRLYTILAQRITKWHELIQIRVQDRKSVV